MLLRKKVTVVFKELMMWMNKLIGHQIDGAKILV